MLHRLADSSGGLYCYIEEGEMIAAAFAECLGGLQALVAQNVRLEISVPPVLGATIRSVVTTYRSQLYDEEAHGGAEGNAKAVIFFGDLQSGESRDVVIDIDLPPADTSSGPVAQDVLLLSVEYFDVGRSATCSELPTAVSVSRTHDDGAVTTGTASEVDTQRCRVLVAQTMAVARERAAAGDLAGAREALQSAQRAVAAPQVAGTELGRELSRDLEQCLERLQPGLAGPSAHGFHTLSMLSASHGLQRSLSGQFSLERTSSYRTSSQHDSMMRSRAATVRGPSPPHGRVQRRRALTRQRTVLRRSTS